MGPLSSIVILGMVLATVAGPVRSRYQPGMFSSRYEMFDDGTFADESLYNEQQQIQQQLQQEQQTQVSFVRLYHIIAYFSPGIALK